MDTHHRTAERADLAEKLDKELESFIAGLEKRSSNEAWPEDKWQEEMEKHPFFMTKLPESGEIPPLLQGLQDLKYSSEENTPEELAKAYKDDGNFHYKIKKYRMAILCYTEGIKQRCNDVELHGQLYNNRAAAHYYLGNYRSCYNDCKYALRTIPFYTKAISRLAHACFQLGLYEECVNNCKLLNTNGQPEKNISELEKIASKKQKEKLREERKKDILEKKLNIEKNSLLKAIKERNICLLDEDDKEIEVDGGFEHLFSSVVPQKVHLVDEKLVWPVLFLYPEYETSDCIENFSENHMFKNELEEIFSSFADWDVEHKYSLSTIRLYYENCDKELKLVDLSSTLGFVLSEKEVRCGMPTFLIVEKDSDTEKRLLQNPK